eukprot:462546_1
MAQRFCFVITVWLYSLTFNTANETNISTTTTLSTSDNKNVTTHEWHIYAPYAIFGVLVCLIFTFIITAAHFIHKKFQQQQQLLIPPFNSERTLIGRNPPQNYIQHKYPSHNNVAQSPSIFIKLTDQCDSKTHSKKN